MPWDSIGLATLAASADDFSQANYPGLMNRLFAQLEQVKLRRFDLCNTPSALFMPDYLERFEQDTTDKKNLKEKGVCAVDGRSPAVVKLEDKWISRLADDQIRTGSALTRCDRLVLSREPFGDKPDALQIPVFGFYVCFIADTTEITPTHRVIDFALPQDEHSVLWRGYARRAINAWIPLADTTDKAEEDAGKYIGVDEDLYVGAAKTLNHLACENRYLDQHGNWKGIAALMTLKGDVDDLGRIFKDGLPRPGFAKTAALSRQMNAFFSLWLPYRCKQRPAVTTDQAPPDYRNTYTVFAGGDDFFLIGPWHSTILLAQEMREKFRLYVAGNPQVHFSAGLSMSKPSLPVNYLAHHAEAALSDAKDHIPPAESQAMLAATDKKPQDNLLCNPKIHPIKPKNAVCCFERAVSWEDFNQLLSNAEQLGELREYFRLSSGYFYDLLHLVSLREGMHKHPEYAIWNSKFQYRTWRLLESSRTKDGRKLSYDERKRKLNELAQSIAAAGINQYQGDYRIALFTHLYQHRS
ncbi:MAG: type III-A CRISPR-associated protein Cas10/Csm1 [Thiolinea sp.]